jgi:hypothetical protein
LQNKGARNSEKGAFSLIFRKIVKRLIYMRKKQKEAKNLNDAKVTKNKRKWRNISKNYKKRK